MALAKRKYDGRANFKHQPGVSRDPDELIADEIAKYYADPLGYVMLVFPWDSDPSIQLVELVEPWKSRFNSKYGPDEWACKFLDQVGAEVKHRGFNGRVSVEPAQYATASGHGIGKSVIVAWLIKWIMDTRPFAKGVVTAGTDAQLRTKTWAELGKWNKLSLTSHWFNYNTGRGAMALVHKQYPEQWRCDAQTCREENSEAFAGLHAANSTPFYIFDEASAVPDKIYEVREGGTTDGEPMTFDFGNPTRNSGRFYEEMEGRFRHRYIRTTVDSRNVAITNKDRIKQWEEDYGPESDFFKVRVRGVFPSAGSAQFIPTADVEAAMARPDGANDRSARVRIGVDVARFGDDDSVIWARLGNDARSFPPDIYNGLDTVALVGKIIEKVRFFRGLGQVVEAIFVDGGGVGGGVVDQLRALGYNVIEVQFGGKPIDTSTYRFKSDEMWGRLREGIKSRLILPTLQSRNGVRIKEELTQREFGYTLVGNKIHLETKADMKARGAGSPDTTDALALTYAFDVAPVAELAAQAASFRRADHDYDPLATKW